MILNNQLLDRLSNAKGYEKDTELTVDDLKKLCQKFKQIINDLFGSFFPDDANTQLINTIQAVLKSWNALYIEVMTNTAPAITAITGRKGIKILPIAGTNDPTKNKRTAANEAFNATRPFVHNFLVAPPTLPKPA